IIFRGTVRQSKWIHWPTPGPPQQSHRHGERPLRIDHVIYQQHRLRSNGCRFDGESPKQVLRLLKTVGTSLLGFSIPDLADTLHEWEPQAACESPREVRDKSLVLSRGNA